MVEAIKCTCCAANSSTNHRKAVSDQRWNCPLASLHFIGKRTSAMGTSHATLRARV
nr:hypothetical protein Iba_chr05cCG9840 [Ipomoea batatas]